MLIKCFKNSILLSGPYRFSVRSSYLFSLFQGRDKDVIIYSCTRTKVAKSGRKNAGSDIMSNWRRINVAVTRAKARLWMIGNVDTLKNYAPFEKLLDYLASKDLIFQLTDI